MLSITNTESNLDMFEIPLLIVAFNENGFERGY